MHISTCISKREIQGVRAQDYVALPAEQLTFAPCISERMIGGHAEVLGTNGQPIAHFVGDSGNEVTLGFRPVGNELAELEEGLTLPVFRMYSKRLHITPVLLNWRGDMTNVATTASWMAVLSRPAVVLSRGACNNVSLQWIIVLGLRQKIAVCPLRKQIAPIPTQTCVSRCEPTPTAQLDPRPESLPAANA